MNLIEQHKSEATLQETIRTQQAEIERLKGQRDRLLEMLSNIKSELSEFNWRGDAQEEITELIAEIEAEK